LNVDTGNLFDDIVDSRYSEADFFSEPWMYRLKESSPYSESTCREQNLTLWKINGHVQEILQGTWSK
jgi:hypothetical protein